MRLRNLLTLYWEGDCLDLTGNCRQLHQLWFQVCISHDVQKALFDRLLHDFWISQSLYPSSTTVCASDGSRMIQMLPLWPSTPLHLSFALWQVVSFCVNYRSLQKETPLIRCGSIDRHKFRGQCKTMSFQQNYHSRFSPGATEVLKVILKMFCRVKEPDRKHTLTLKPKLKGLKGSMEETHPDPENRARETHPAPDQPVNPWASWKPTKYHQACPNSGIEINQCPPWKSSPWKNSTLWNPIYILYLLGLELPFSVLAEAATLLDSPPLYKSLEWGLGSDLLSSEWNWVGK